MDHAADISLVRRALEEHDPRAYAALITRHYPAAYRQACHLVGDPIEAQDLVQEAFLTAHLQLHTLRDPCCYRVWLREIVHSTCMDWHRRCRFDLYRSANGSSSTYELEDLADPCTPTRRWTTCCVRNCWRICAKRWPICPPAIGCPAVSTTSSNSVVKRWPRNWGCPWAPPCRCSTGRAASCARRWTTIWTRRPAGRRSGWTSTRQGWRYRSGYEFLAGGPPEARVCQVHQGVLTLDTADLFPDTFAAYLLYGVVDPYRPFVLHWRARKLRETARYPEYQVPLVCNRLRNCSFGVSVYTGREMFGVGIGFRQLYLNGQPFIPGTDHRQFHDYRLEGTPGVGCRLFVDERYVGAALPDNRPIHRQWRNGIGFGDLSAATGNFRAELTHLSFTQMKPGRRMPHSIDRSSAAELLELRPFAAQGSLEFTFPRYSGRQASAVSQPLHAVVRRYSRTWKLGPTEPFLAMDFSQG